MNALSMAKVSRSPPCDLSISVTRSVNNATYHTALWHVFVAFIVPFFYAVVRLRGVGDAFEVWLFIYENIKTLTSWAIIGRKIEAVATFEVTSVRAAVMVHRMRTSNQGGTSVNTAKAWPIAAARPDFWITKAIYGLLHKPFTRFFCGEERKSRGPYFVTYAP